MKKLVVLAVVAALVGCTKESEIALNPSNSDRVEQSIEGSFDVGTIDANGVATFTYDLDLLGDITSCAVSEESTSGLRISYVAGVGYFLEGVGESANSFTTFSVTLTLNGDVLSWDDNAVIFTCETTSDTPCEIAVIDAQTYDCDNNDVCGQNIIGGSTGGGYNACEWPWLVAKKTTK